MKEVYLWFIIWFSVWGLFNIKVRWILEKFHSRKYTGRGLFFLFAFIITSFYFDTHVTKYLPQLLVGTLLANILGIFFAFFKNYYKKFAKDRFFLLFQTFNILFQQTMVVIAISILKIIFGQEYKDYYFGIWFFMAHLPVLFVPWAKLRYQYVIYALIGGIVFSYLINNISNGLIITFLTHFCIYIWVISYLKDEEKI